MLSYTYIVGLPCAYLFVILNLLQAESALWGSLKWSLGSSAVLAGFLLYAARFFESHTSNRDVDVRHLPVYRLPLYTLHAVAAAIPLGEGASIVALICLWCTHIFRYRPQLRWGALGLYFSLYGLGLILGFVGAGKINCGWSAVSHVLPFSLLLWGRFYGAFYTQKHIERCLGFFLASYSVALLFGFFCFLTNTRPFEDWIHAVANSHGQSLIPYTSYTAPTGFYFHRLIMSHVGLITI
jgi:hypothetical protein